MWDSDPVENQFITKLGRLASLSDAAVSALEHATANAAAVGARRDLIREGDQPGPLLVILDGWACRYKILPNGARQMLAFLMPGDSCDLHVDLLTEMDHGIQTITPCTVAKIDRPTIETVFEQHPSVMKAMYLAQLIDEGTLRAWITSIGRRSSIERVAHLMCELYLRARNIGLGGDMHLVLPLSQIVLADALGMTPVHINRVLKQLRLAGAMTIVRGSLIIVSPQILVQIAGFDENYLHRRLQNAA
jgi:CRP-like cAMP-binding protein